MPDTPELTTQKKSILQTDLANPNQSISVSSAVTPEPAESFTTLTSAAEVDIIEVVPRQTDPTVKTASTKPSLLERISRAINVFKREDKKPASPVTPSFAAEPISAAEVEVIEVEPIQTDPNASLHHFQTATVDTVPVTLAVSPDLVVASPAAPAVLDPVAVDEITPEELQEQQNKRKHIIKEIYDTEGTYNTSLNHFQTKFIDKLNTLKQTDDVRALRELLAKLSAITDCSYQVLQEIEKKCDENADGSLEQTSAIAQVLIDHAKEMKIAYSAYIAVYNQIQELDTKLTRKNKQYATLSQEFTLLSGRKNYQSHAIMPVQRVPRYVLLVKELLKNTPEVATAPVARAAVDLAHVTMQDVGGFLNESKRKAEDAATKKSVTAQALPIPAKFIDILNKINELKEKKQILQEAKQTEANQKADKMQELLSILDATTVNQQGKNEIKMALEAVINNLRTGGKAFDVGALDALVKQLAATRDLITGTLQGTSSAEQDTTSEKTKSSSHILSEVITVLTSIAKEAREQAAKEKAEINEVIEEALSWDIIEVEPMQSPQPMIFTNPARIPAAGKVAVAEQSEKSKVSTLRKA